jgi:hypothetical protein
MVKQQGLGKAVGLGAALRACKGYARSSPTHTALLNAQNVPMTHASAGRKLLWELCNPALVLTTDTR